MCKLDLLTVMQCPARVLIAGWEEQRRAPEQWVPVNVNELFCKVWEMLSPSSTLNKNMRVTDKIVKIIMK